MSTGTMAIEGVGLLHRYGRRSGVRAPDFRFDGPAVVAVRGANGAGKSTLLRILAGLLRPTRGRTTFTLAGRPVADTERRRAIGYAAPDLAFYPEFTAEENLAFAAEALGLPHPAAAARAALVRVGLERRGGDRVAGLSSGMGQRLRLAFALLHDPPLVLLDEPGSHLDESGRRGLEAVLERERSNRLLVLATNDEREWSRADCAIELHGDGLGDPA